MNLCIAQSSMGDLLGRELLAKLVVEDLVPINLSEEVDQL